MAEVAPQKLSGTIQKQTSIFQWKNICYDIQIKKEERRILDRVDGWVKPGTLTALMVSSTCHSSRLPFPCGVLSSLRRRFSIDLVKLLVFD
jgi:hypothetical protein